MFMASPKSCSYKSCPVGIIVSPPTSSVTLTRSDFGMKCADLHTRLRLYIRVSTRRIGLRVRPLTIDQRDLNRQNRGELPGERPVI